MCEKERDREREYNRVEGGKGEYKVIYYGVSSAIVVYLISDDDNCSVFD